ncbi:hypothetical protein EJB05_18533 [Eragrostis curvula]|uniref:Uncharacterized protein n=1 Tax=Eragrostis curvula TaxID=38414 RepID=A0A5J9VM41_9POAL|nr:hypothetical protein EJB05_18533 [Eragrostis curvula]
MEQYTWKRKPLLAILVLACLLLPLVSAAPLSRSLSLRNHQPLGPGLEVPAHQGSTFEADQKTNHGEVVAARMDIEINDYPGSGANNRHEPRSPGRA